ncbi:hypothetical protein HDU79_003989 [Rhizoclosmatium sp. JEL0117]|nr:hypothetical protein HDU79_003989 [Rhizoclosmatium sp. JEL0117]
MHIILFIEAFVASILALTGIVLFAVSRPESAIQLIPLGDWGLVATVWSIMTIGIVLMRRVLETKDEPWTLRGFHHKIRSAVSPISVVALICFILSIVSFFGQVLARSVERVTAVGCFLNAVACLVFIAAHARTKHLTGHTVSSHIRANHNLVFWIVYVPLAVLFGGLFFVLQIMATYQSVSLASDYRTYQAPGEMWSVGGPYSHKLHVYCTGTKQNASHPLVWIEHGLGGQHYDLTWVQRNMSAYARVCSYDHSGYGFSEPGPVPRNTFQIVDELRNLLVTNNVTDDLFFVGHSMAGFNTRVAQRLIKNKVVGLVLADPVSYLDYNGEGCKEGNTDTVNALYNFGVQTATFGTTRALSKTSSFPESQYIRSLPDADYYFANVVNVLSQALRVSESAYWPTSCGYTKRILFNGTQGSDSLGDLPFGLVTAQGPGAVNSQTLGNVSTVFLHETLPNAPHVGLVMDPVNAAVVWGVAEKVWKKAVFGVSW